MTHGHGDHSAGHDGPVLDAAHWDGFYGNADAVWSGNANPHLVTEATDLSPGTALDVGCGEGADALWLARHGWRVTAIDISTVALRRAAAHAESADAEAAARITWTQADLDDWVPTEKSFDLVSAQFMQLPSAQRDAVWRRLAGSVAEGGSLLVVGHHISDLGTSPKHPMPDMFYTSDEVAAVLDKDEWDVVVSENRPADHSDSHGMTIEDTVLLARRAR
jgi:SAM-dependent methyltransferase